MVSPKTVKGQRSTTDRRLREGQALGHGPWEQEWRPGLRVPVTAAHRTPRIDPVRAPRRPAHLMADTRRSPLIPPLRGGLTEGARAALRPVGFEIPRLCLDAVPSHASDKPEHAMCMMLASAGSASDAWPAAIAGHAPLHPSVGTGVLTHSEVPWRAEPARDAVSAPLAQGAVGGARRPPSSLFW